MSDEQKLYDAVYESFSNRNETRQHTDPTLGKDISTLNNFFKIVKRLKKEGVLDGNEDVISKS